MIQGVGVLILLVPAADRHEIDGAWALRVMAAGAFNSAADRGGRMAVS